MEASIKKVKFEFEFESGSKVVVSVTGEEFADKQFLNRMIGYIKNVYIRDIWPYDKVMTDEEFLKSYIDGKYGEGTFQDYKAGTVDINDSYLRKLNRVITVDPPKK